MSFTKGNALGNCGCRCDAGKVWDYQGVWASQPLYGFGALDGSSPTKRWLTQINTWVSIDPNGTIFTFQNQKKIDPKTGNQTLTWLQTVAGSGTGYNTYFDGLSLPAPDQQSEYAALINQSSANGPFDVISQTVTATKSVVTYANVGPNFANGANSGRDAGTATVELSDEWTISDAAGLAEGLLGAVDLLNPLKLYTPIDGSTPFHFGYLADWLVIARTFNIIPAAAKYDADGNYYVTINAPANSRYGWIVTDANNYWVAPLPSQSGELSGHQNRPPSLAFDSSTGLSIAQVNFNTAKGDNRIMLFGIPGAPVTAYLLPNPDRFTQAMVSYTAAGDILIKPNGNGGIGFGQGFGQVVAANGCCANGTLIAYAVKSAIRAYPSGMGDAYIFPSYPDRPPTAFSIFPNTYSIAQRGATVTDTPGEYIFQPGDVPVPFALLTLNPPQQILLVSAGSGTVVIALGPLPLIGNDGDTNQLQIRGGNMKDGFFWLPAGTLISNTPPTWQVSNLAIGQICYFRVVTAQHGQMPAGVSAILAVTP